MLPFQLSRKWNQCSPHMVPHWMTNPTAENQLRVCLAAAGVHLGFEKNWWLFSRWCRTHTVGPTFPAAARPIPSILLRDCWQQFATDINGPVLHVVLSGNCSSSTVAGKSHPLRLHLKKKNQVFQGKTGVLSQIRDLFKKSKMKHILHSAWHYPDMIKVPLEWYWWF